MSREALNRRFLLISSWAPPMVGGPQILRYLLSPFPEDSYAVLTSYQSIVRQRVLGPWLSANYYFYDHPNNNGQRSVTISGDDIKSTPVSRARRLFRGLQQVSTRNHTLNWLFQSSSRILSLSNLTTRIFTTGILVVRGNGIGCLFAMSDWGPALIATFLLSKWTHLPYVLYLVDIYRGNDLPFPANMVARMLEPRLIKQAHSVVFLTDGMRELYIRRYGSPTKFYVVRNPSTLSVYDPFRTDYRPSKPYTIVFTGSVYWAQERSLRNLIETMDELNDLPIKLKLYVPTPDESLKKLVERHPNVTLSAASQAEIRVIQCEATILFLPLSWHTSSPEVISTAFPTKLIDYMASGRPILIHTPPYAYVTKYAKQEQFALVVETENKVELKKAIITLLSDTALARSIIRNATRVLLSNHDLARNSRSLAQIIDNAAKAP